MVYKILLGVAVILSFGSTFVLLNNSRRNNNYLQVVLSVLLLISNIGYFFLASSTSLGEALLANALSYIGGIFLPMMVPVVRIFHINGQCLPFLCNCDDRQISVLLR